MILRAGKTVADLMTADVVTVLPETSVRKATATRATLNHRVPHTRQHQSTGRR